MEIKLNINDCKKIADNVTKKNTELEVCLARKLLASDRRNAELKQEISDLSGILQGIYDRVTGNKFAERLKERRKAQLAGQSRAHFAQAVKMDGQLKELIDDGNGEGKDCGRDGEA